MQSQVRKADTLICHFWATILTKLRLCCQCRALKIVSSQKGYSNGLPMSVDEPLHNIDLVDEFGNIIHSHHMLMPWGCWSIFKIKFLSFCARFLLLPAFLISVFVVGIFGEHAAGGCWRSLIFLWNMHGLSIASSAVLKHERLGLLVPAPPPGNVVPKVI